MPDIGATLREARLRQKLDISEAEAATKIRAKYLRALEHEDFDLLPGPTFVRTFLRSYAEYLGLDPRPLVEEYRMRHERVTGPEYPPIAPGLARRRERRRMRPILTPGVLLALGAVLLIGALYLLGRWGEDDTAQAPAPTPTPRAAAGGDRDDRAAQRRARQRRPTRVRLQIVATGLVYVCLENAAGDDVVDQETLQTGERRGPFRSRRFRVTFGNGAAIMRLGRRRVDVPESDGPIAYELRPARRPRRVDPAQGPTCA